MQLQHGQTVLVWMAKEGFSLFMAVTGFHCCWGLQVAQGGSAAEGGPDAAALQAHLDSAMQSGLIQMNGLQPSEAGLGGPTDPARDGGQSAGAYIPPESCFPFPPPPSPPKCP